jgi:hypothetical protein
MRTPQEMLEHIKKVQRDGGDMPTYFELLDALQSLLEDDVEIIVPITEEDIEHTFKPIVYKDEGGDTWSYEANTGQNVVIKFIGYEDTE